MKRLVLLALWLAAWTSLGAADGLFAPPPTGSQPAVTVTPGRESPAPSLQTFDGRPYEALRLPFWTDDFIEPWVPSDVPRDHWSYEWLSWMAEEGMLRRIFPVEEYTPPDAPAEYLDLADLDRVPELLDSVIRLTDEGIIIGGADGSFDPKRAATRLELGLVACRTALHLRSEHARMVTTHPPGPPAERVNLNVSATRYELAEALIRVMRGLGPLDLAIRDCLSVPREEWDLPDDVPPYHRFAPAVHAARTLGVLRGLPDGTFAGDDVVLRQEVAVSFTRMLDVLGSRPEGVQ